MNDERMLSANGRNARVVRIVDFETRRARRCAPSPHPRPHLSHKMSPFTRPELVVRASLVSPPPPSASHQPVPPSPTFASSSFFPDSSWSASARDVSSRLGRASGCTRAILGPLGCLHSLQRLDGSQLTRGDEDAAREARAAAGGRPAAQGARQGSRGYR